MALTIPKIKNAKTKDKDYKLSDEKGLYLLVSKNGSKYWRAKYRIGGREKLLALGVFPEVSLKEARKEWIDARKDISNQIDPNEKKKKRLAERKALSDTFEKVAREWLKLKIGTWAERTAKKNSALLENDLIPSIGRYPIDQIDTPLVLDALRKIEARGAFETANRVKQLAGQVFRYAVSIGLSRYDPTSNFDKDSLRGHKVKHHAAITTPREAGLLMLAIDGYGGSKTVKAALKLSPLLFCRPGELRAMTWAEIDWQEEIWVIPAERMKMGESHIVPLSTQSMAILQKHREVSGNGIYVFPSPRGASRCLSDNAVRVALRSLGYEKDQMTAHGFRAMARTLLDEVLEVKVEWIEQQLAHSVKDALGRAYNRTKHLPQRKQMMQRWADYLDDLKSQATQKRSSGRQANGY